MGHTDTIVNERQILQNLQHRIQAIRFIKINNYNPDKNRRNWGKTAKHILYLPRWPQPTYKWTDKISSHKFIAEVFLLQKNVVPGKFTKCESCHMKQLTTDLVKSTVLKMNVLDDKHEIHRLTAFEQTVKTFVEKEKISSLLEDPESLEEFLLGKTVNISVYNGICRALKFIATTESCTNIVQKK